MRWDDLKLLTVVPALLVGLIFLASCATPPPTQELADAEAAYADATAAGCPECAPEECAAAESALKKGKALYSEWCSELEARRLLIDARALALEATNKCNIPPPPPLVPIRFPEPASQPIQKHVETRHSVETELQRGRKYTACQITVPGSGCLVDLHI